MGESVKTGIYIYDQGCVQFRAELSSLLNINLIPEINLKSTFIVENLNLKTLTCIIIQKFGVEQLSKKIKKCYHQGCIFLSKIQ